MEKAVYSAVLTPFKKNLTIDTKLFISHCEFLLKNNISLAPLGTTGEANSISISEKLDLIKVIILYSIVGFLFIASAAIFGLSKAVPDGKIEGEFEPSKKALRSLLIMTGLLIVAFVPVFSSYSSKEAKQLEW